MNLQDFFGYSFYGNSVERWIAALVLALGLLVLFRFIQGLVLKRIQRLSERTTTTLDDLLAKMISRTRLFVLLVVASAIGAQLLLLSETADIWLDRIILVAILFQVGIWGNALLEYGISRYVRLSVKDESTQVASTSALTFLTKLALWVIVFTMALDMLEYDVTALITGLGIGGIAIALAAQNILGDLFASLSIMFDKPFVVGDFLVVGDMRGTVERIGLKTTRIRSLDGEQLVFSNTDLLSSRLRNFKRMYERRILFRLGVTYQTPYEKIQAIPEILKEIIESQEQARLDRVHFAEYGDFALIFEVVYWVERPDYNTYMDIQQKINLAVYHQFEKQGIEFAYPTQTIHLGTTDLAGTEGSGGPVTTPAEEGSSQQT